MPSLPILRFPGTARPSGVRALPLLILLALGGCSAVQPTQGQPSLKSTPDPIQAKIGICYNNLVSDDADVLRAARRACGANGEPHLIDQDTDLTCPLSISNRSTFACGAARPVPKTP